MNKVKGKAEMTHDRTLTFPLSPFYFTLAYCGGPGGNLGHRGPAADARDPAADQVAGRAAALEDDNLVGIRAAEPAGIARARAFNQQFEFPVQHPAVELGGDAVLHLNQAGEATARVRLGDLGLELLGAGAGPEPRRPGSSR